MVVGTEQARVKIPHGFKLLLIKHDNQLLPIPIEI